MNSKDAYEGCEALLARAGRTVVDLAEHAGLTVRGIPRQRLLTEAQAMEFLGGMSKHSFYAFVALHRIRRIPLSERLVRYDVEEINGVIEALKHGGRHHDDADSES